MEEAPGPPRKRFGQNFLVDARVVSWIVDRCRVGSGRRIIEIGPGRGALTRPLVSAGAEMVAVELDRDLAKRLTYEKWIGPAPRIVTADAVEIEWESVVDEWFGPETKPTVVGNLPYNVATPIVRELLRRIRRFERLVLMFQHEVADRLSAEGGDEYGYLSVERALSATIVDRHDVGPGAFNPVPKVASSVLVLEARPDLPSPELAERAIRLASAGFAHRRKLFARNAAAAFSAPSAEVVGALRTALETHGLPATARAEEISPEIFLALARELPFPLAPRVR